MSHAIAVSHGEFGRAALYKLNKDIINHAHREGHLIFYVDGCEPTVTVADEANPLARKSAIAVSPWEPHSFNINSSKTNICLVLYIKPMWFLENTQSAEFALKFGCTRIRVTRKITNFINQLTTFLLDNEHQLKFDEILYGMTKACFDQSWSGDDTASSRKPTYDRFSDFRVRRSLRLIQERIGEDVDMEQMARSVGLSRPHFFKLFKQYMGVTPNVYMNTIRSERAIDDLLNSAKSVTDIAFDLGFSSQASFTRFFSSNVGIAPSEYRRVAHVTTGAFPMM